MSVQTRDMGGRRGIRMETKSTDGTRLFSPWITRPRVVLSTMYGFSLPRTDLSVLLMRR